MKHFNNRTVCALVTVFALGISTSARADDAAKGKLHLDPTKVVGEEQCATCHKMENEAWHKTHHFETFNTLHKNPKAKEVAEKMGLTSIKKNDTCVNCHYTMQTKDGAPTAISGVSCESCHGAAADWIKIHNDFGAGKTKETEDAAHRDERRKKADAAGMIRKDRIDLIADNCLSCHTVSNEELVNKGGHKAGSDFELVSWSQGEVRHNYFGSDKNKEETPERLRVLYVVGVASDLESSLRAVASAATAGGDFQKAMVARAKAATAKMDAIVKTNSVPEFADVFTGMERNDQGALKLGKAMVEPLSKKVAECSHNFVQKNDGKNLAALDALIPKKDAYKGTSQP